ncbi:MAG: helix-turn-helix domain-containing protein [Thermoleophilaceae bacterium]|nr:helix-turn-helix domain-containing protein [Thermoleophilaceae bacterium]
MEKPVHPATPATVSSGDLPDVLTVEQAAELLQLSGKTLKRLAQAGRIPGRRVGNQWRFSRQGLMDWLAGKDA